MENIIPFLTACYEGNKVLVKDYLENGGDIDAVSELSGTTGLRAACQSNQPKMVEFLLANGSDPNKKIWIVSRVSGHEICSGGYVIFYARSEKIVDVLVKYQADLKVTDEHGCGVAEWWRKHGYKEKMIARYFP